MAKNTVTLVLTGEVTLSDFAKAIQEFHQLINALGMEVAANIPMEWQIDNLEAGSAITTAKGFSESDTGNQAVEKVVRAFEDVGKALQQGVSPTYSETVRSSAYAIAGLIDGRIRSVRFETDETDAEIYKLPSPLVEHKSAPISYGAVQGRVQSLSNRKQLRFTLYKLLDDGPVSCYLEPGSEDIMREAWGKPAIVEGLIRRNPDNGQPTTVRQIRSIQILSEGKSGSWREVLGAVPNRPGDLLPEEAVRRLRDA